MIELIALFLTGGALVYQSFHMSLVDSAILSCFIIVGVFLMIRTMRGLLFGLLLGMSFVCGALLLWQHDEVVPKEVFGDRAFDAQIVSVDRRLDKTVLVVNDTRYDTKLGVTLYSRQKLLPGDRVAITGRVMEPEDFVTETGRVFPYEEYLASKGIVGVVYRANTHVVSKGGFSLSRVTTILRFRIADIFAQYVSFPVDGVLSGMLVGYQGGLPQSIQDLFKHTGVLHVLVLSGYNITLLAGFLGLLMRRLPFRLRTILIIICITLLVLISGAGVASVRAGVMGSIALFAGLSIHTYRPFRALTIAYLFFFIVSPSTIFVDPGFHLSFLATLFMILVLPKIESWFHFIPSTPYVDVRELLLLAILVPIFMLPYTMYFNGSFPLASPFANIVLAIVTPAIMLLGIMVLSVSWIPFLGAIVGGLISVLGRFIIWLLEVFNHLPIWNTPPLAWWGVDLIYIVFLVWLFRVELMTYVSQLRNSLRRQTSSYS